MSFRFWFYLAKGALFLFIAAAAGFVFPRVPVLKGVSVVAVAILGLLCIIGAVLGLINMFGTLRMSCPFCGRPAKVGGDRKHGMWLSCETCGNVRGTGFLRLRLSNSPGSHAENPGDPPGE